MLAALLVSASVRDAGAEPADWLHLETPSNVQTDGGTNLRLPPGYFAEEDTWLAQDAEMRRLQDAENRLKAENKSLREDADSISFGWYTVAGAIVAGFAIGYAIGK